MVSQYSGDRRWDSFLTGMDRTDGVQELSVYFALQDVSPRTSFKSAQHLSVARVRRQHDDSGIGKFASNADDCLDTAQAGHLKVHQRYIRPVHSEFLDSILSVGGLSDQLHVRFCIDQRCDPLAEEGMIVDGKNPDRDAVSGHHLSPFYGIV